MGKWIFYAGQPKTVIVESKVRIPRCYWQKTEEEEGEEEDSGAGSIAFQFDQAILSSS